MSKHTPGPWKARKVEGPGWPGQRGWNIDYNDDQEQVTDFVYEEADAHLIAAAPDLLEALEYVKSEIEEMSLEYWWIECPDKGGIDVEKINAAIAKAKGQ